MSQEKFATPPVDHIANARASIAAAQTELNRDNATGHYNPSIAAAGQKLAEALGLIERGVAENEAAQSA